MQFTDDEIEIIKEVLADWGSDCPSTDYKKVQAIGVKLGVWEEFKNNPYGQVMSKILNQSNEYLDNMAQNLMRE